MAKFAEEIDGELASVSFDPANPASIEAALQQISDAIDEKRVRRHIGTKPDMALALRY